MKCKPQCPKCKQNVFLRVILIKQSHHMDKKWYFAGFALPRWSRNKRRV